MEGPSAILTFLGFKMDTTFGLPRSPVGQLVEFQIMILNFFAEEEGKPWHEFQVLLGHLNFLFAGLLQVIRSAYTQLLQKKFSAHYFVVITKELEGDSLVLQLHSDAAGGLT